MTDAAAPADRTVLWLSLAAFASSASIRITDTLLPAIAHDFDTTPGAVAIVASAYALAYGGCQILYGPLGDLLGKLRIVTLGVILAAAAAVACALAPTLGTLALARLLSGAFAAAVIPLSMAHIGDTFAYEHRQATLSRVMLGASLGLVVGQVASGLLAEHVGWRAAFLLVAAAFVVAAVPLLLRLRTAPSPAAAGQRQPLGAAYRAALGLIRRPPVQAIVVAVFAEGMLLYAAVTFVGAHLHDLFALDFGTIGMLIAIYGVGQLAYGALARKLLRHISEPVMVLAGGLILAPAMLVLAYIGDWWLAIPTLFAVGFGFFLVHGTLQARATQMAPDARGAGVAFFASAFFIGQMLGVALGGPLYDHAGGRPIFIVAAIGIAVIAAATSLYLVRAKAS